MIYVVLNITMAVLFLSLSVYIDKQSKDFANNPLIPMSVYLSASTLCMALCIVATLNYIETLPLLSFRISVILISAYAIDFCIYCILFPSYERKPIFKIVKYLYIFFAIWVVFTKINDITITDFLGLNVDSKPLFKGRLTNYFPFTWYELFTFVSLIVLPAFSVLIMILRAENKADRLNMQKSFVNACALIATWVCVYAINLATGRVKMFSTLIVPAIGVGMFVLSYNSRQTFLYDIKYLFGAVVTITVSYIIPAFVVGFLFPNFWPLFKSSPIGFILLMIVIISGCITLSYQISKFLSKKQYFRSFQYAKVFEEQLSKLDYSEEPEEIVLAIKNIFIRNLGLDKVQILIENEGKLNSLFETKENSLTLEANDEFFETMLNQNKTVILRSTVENGHIFESDKKRLLQFFNKTNSQAVILLAEGRRLIGAILLGAKAGGNIYNDYDFNTFTKFYSYFFVFGYYIKNVANQSLVGTINREIKMSSQIITSIQNNMDFVNNPKYDIGWMMEHAHTIGGEFVDLIKLSSTKHIFLMGDLSGKGIAASMSAVIIKSIIRTFLQETKDFKLLVEKVNNFIRFNLPKGTFFEGVFCLIDFSDDTLYYINCGVPALFLYTKSYNNVIEIQGEGRVLGFVKDVGSLIKVKKIKLNPGDIIVTVTDGLIDSKSLRGDVYGKERIQKSIVDCTAYGASVMTKTIYQNGQKFLSKGFDDDVSMLVIKRLSK